MEVVRRLMKVELDGGSEVSAWKWLEVIPPKRKKSQYIWIKQQMSNLKLRNRSSMAQR